MENVMQYSSCALFQAKGNNFYFMLRGSRKHMGIDIWCRDGATVYAPFDVTLHGRVTVYTDPEKAAINDGINLKGEGWSVINAFISRAYMLQ